MRNGSTAVTFPGFVRRADVQSPQLSCSPTATRLAQATPTNSASPTGGRTEGLSHLAGFGRAGADVASSHYCQCLRSRIGFNRAIPLWQQLPVPGDANQAEGPARISLRRGVPQANDYASAGGQDLGTISFTNSVGYSAFATFLDDFSGPSASVTRVFVLRPSTRISSANPIFFRTTGRQRRRSR